MPAAKLTRVALWVIQIILLAGMLGAAALLSHPDEWEPVALVGLLLGLSLLGHLFSVELTDGVLSASLVAIVLAMALLGPAPAAACGLAPISLRSVVRRVTPAQWLNNLTVFGVVPFTGGVMVRALAGDVHRLHSHHLGSSVVFGLIVLGVFAATVALNLLVFGFHELVEEGRSIVRQVREFIPLVPGELASGLLATILAIAYVSAGLPVLIGSIVVLLVFQHLTVALLRSEARAEALQARSRQLVGLQLGVLRTLVRALGMRDKAGSRHAAAVARYVKALATELGCSEEERDTMHAAGLLHEIGKFTWPDRVLLADVVEEADQGIVRSHPQEGAILVGALDGYGAVADAILYHHERMDGRGYPAGLIGSEIPLSSRALAVCSTYDAMTAGTYNPALTPLEAMAELRHAAASGQLDPNLVETFIALLEREGPSFAEDVDFETELEFERRVRDLAEPDTAAFQPATPRRVRGRHPWPAGLRRPRIRTPNRG
jgi:HD-GYP domain-containing protein (c-di-GMP phosphodiesterase class II)